MCRQNGQSSANVRGRVVRGPSKGGHGARTPSRGKVYHVDQREREREREREQNNEQDERNVDIEPTNLIELEWQLQLYDSCSSNDYGVNAFDDVTKNNQKQRRTPLQKAMK